MAPERDADRTGGSAPVDGARRETLTVEVAYGLRDRQALVVVELKPGATVREAIDASGLDGEFPDLVVDQAMVGVFGQRVPFDHVLKSGDRVEIYRPLQVDPKAARRARAEASRRGD